MRGTMVRLPHPAKELRPNGRAHWAAKARAVKKARFVAKVMMHEALAWHVEGPAVSGVRGIRYELKWFYKGAVPDADNCLAACKAYLDGCCDALGVNDRELECHGIERVHDKEKAGQVEIFFMEV